MEGPRPGGHGIAIDVMQEVMKLVVKNTNFWSLSPANTMWLTSYSTSNISTLATCKAHGILVTSFFVVAKDLPDDISPLFLLALLLERGSCFRPEVLAQFDIEAAVKLKPWLNMVVTRGDGECPPMPVEGDIDQLLFDVLGSGVRLLFMLSY